MQFKIFTIPIADDGTATEEMNKFLRSHKVLGVETHCNTSTQGDSGWHFCVKYLANAQPDEKPQIVSKVDYKEVLDEKTFAVFSNLREIRKKIAEENAMPVYAIFTNEELAGVASLDEITADTIKKVKGIGDKKAERFGKRLAELWVVGAGLAPALAPTFAGQPQGLPLQNHETKDLTPEK